jgi:uncharacterized membrane protein YphA (DoxX/SURF4 family)
MTDFLDSLREPHVLLYFRVLIGGLLVIAGVAKLMDRAAFYDAVADYDVLPTTLARPFANLVPLFELVAGTLLLFGLFTVPAAVLAVPLFGSFAVAIGVNISRGRHIDCHCFGAATNDSIGWSSFLRALLLSIAALYVAVGASTFGALDALIFGTPDDLPPATDAVAVYFLAFVTIDVMFLLPEFAAIRAAFRERQGHGHARADIERGAAGRA